MRGIPASLLLSGMLLASGGGVQAAPCEPAGGFDAWRNDFRREALAAGISQATVSAAFSAVGYDPKVIDHDRNQKAFAQPFETFFRRVISLNRLETAGRMMEQHSATLARIEQEFGVPPGVIVAIWGLESDFGAKLGKAHTIRALASLAYDCRRTDLFQGELLAALQIVDRGDLTPGQMHGGWAGELGQTQFLPSAYLRFAIDYDGDGRRDLLHSIPDVLASTANFLKGRGWKPQQPWMPGDPNFAVLLNWNQNEVYARTIAAFAARLDRGNK